MKKVLSLGLALALSLSLAVPSFAAGTSISTDGGSGETVVSYGMSQGFVVTIPADFDIDASLKATAEVSAENVMIPYGTTLNVRVSGDDYVDSWELIDQASASNQLTYEINMQGETDLIENNDIVLSVNSGAAYDTEVVEIMEFEIVDTVVKAGTYKDTLTFTVSVD